MPLYQVRCLDGGRIVERDDIDADDDGEALALLSLRGEKTDCELWCGDRRVATIYKGDNPVRATRAAASPWADAPRRGQNLL